MQIDKQQIIDLLRQQGNDQQAQQADQQLGIDPQELIGRFLGGGGITAL